MVVTRRRSQLASVGRAYLGCQVVTKYLIEGSLMDPRFKNAQSVRVSSIQLLEQKLEQSRVLLAKAARWTMTE